MGVASLLALTLIATATFAWFSSKDTIVNHLETTGKPSDGDVHIIEAFDPPGTWSPGQTIDKQVSVINRGTKDVLVRVSFEEIMTLNQKAKGSAKPIDDPSNAKELPEYFNTEKYKGQAGWNAWKDVTSEFTLEGSGVNTPGLKFKMMKRNMNGNVYGYEYAVWYEIQQGPNKGKAQRVTADFKLNGKKLTVSNIKYLQNNTKTTKVAWADFGSQSVTGQARTAVKRSDIIYAQSDKTTPGKKLLINYTRVVSNTSLETPPNDTAPVYNRWFYNEDDGFFYFIKPITDGEVSLSLTESLSLAKDAGSEYDGMSYDFIVHMQAIENVDEALTSSKGWGLSTNSAVYKALKPHVKTA
jgi:alternate signal-mediated exported protein